MTVLKGPRPVFDDPGQLMAVMEGYFNSRPPDQYTLTGLALAVGTSRKTIENYGKRPGFRQLVEEARLLVEHSYELRLGGKNYKGAMFALTNLGWDNKSQQEHSFSGDTPKWEIEVTHVRAPK